jgi:hypothetical protein
MNDRKDRDWPARCTLTGCKRPDLRPHHHHPFHGHLDTAPCPCERIDQPGTRRPDSPHCTCEQTYGHHYTCPESVYYGNH